jgi:TATA-binding protein-associated factor Taf7
VRRKRGGEREEGREEGREEEREEGREEEEERGGGDLLINLIRSLEVFDAFTKRLHPHSCCEPIISYRESQSRLRIPLQR